MHRFSYVCPSCEDSYRAHPFPQQQKCGECVAFPPKKFISDSGPEVFIGGWSRGSALPGTYQNSDCHKQHSVSRKSQWHTVSTVLLKAGRPH